MARKGHVGIEPRLNGNMNIGKAAADATAFLYGSYGNGGRYYFIRTRTWRTRSCRKSAQTVGS